MKRRCPCCTEWFEMNTNNFHRAKREAGGFDRYCIGCRRVINRPGNQRYMEKLRAQKFQTVATAT